MTNNWSESPMSKVGYLDSLEPIDKAIAELLSKREKVTEGKWFIPPKDLVDQWAKEFGMNTDLLFWIVRAFTNRRQPSRTGEIGDLQSIVPLMKRTEVNGCVYTLTHIEQHDKCSIVNLTAKLETSDAYQVSQLELLLTLAIEPQNYTITPYGRQGGGSNLSARFLVTPALPHDVTGVKFALLPTPGTNSPPPSVVHELSDPVEF